MKSTSQIANECGITHKEVDRIAVRDNVIPTEVIKRRKFYDKHQEDYLHNVLYFSGTISEITYTSKL